MIYGIVCFGDVVQFRRNHHGGTWRTNPGGDSGDGIRRKWSSLIVLLECDVLARALGSLIGEKGLHSQCHHEFVVGVNMLGVGLHSYGFMDAAFNWLMLFVVSQMLLIALAWCRPAIASFRKSAARRVAWPKQSHRRLKDSDHSDHITAPFVPENGQSKPHCAAIGKPVPAASTAWRWRFAGFVLGNSGRVV